MKYFAISATVFISMTGAAYADYIPPCPVPPGVTSVALPDGLPPALLKTLHATLGDIVAPGENFDATDVIITRKRRRFIFAWHSGPKWVIATEYGGRGYNDPIFLYKVGEDQNLSLVDTKITFPSGVCSTASGLVKE